MSQVKQNDTVKIHYTGKLNDGQVFDSSLEREPIEFTVGGGQIIPGLEKGLIDMKVNEKKTIQIPQDEAYGEAKDELFMEVPKSQLPQEIQPEVGMGLVSKNPDGTERQLRVAEVKEEAIVVDANHPLAGKDLTFEVELVEIK
ncbi:FKBP-type peptidyl-prolyl cis-trans isomerase [Mesonia maritima]|uniref:Peptidyl-prolyl cis-trans isomerase n=1 Tax=Mesonia maritima TaxID=1793873 RepID=A0ABU1K932_9FLAO|nr:peptidylprolyl isomerase [Mesonia maritima]MDR6302109.1 FKBP-type peptidyl-prolyl cis-trans isomerase 2 [Mesonia maritima]